MEGERFLMARLDQQPAPAARRKCPVPLPEKFDGSRDQLPAFLAQAQLYMQLCPEDFSSDQVKVAFLIGLLTGPAAKWAIPYLLQPSPLLANLDGFMQAMRETWGDPLACAPPFLCYCPMGSCKALIS
uniref:DUF4939 domain-containing protein n=1 Tax=Salvator merianae TaxID=96440 RepID=A0A8D0DKD0_SALMN